MKLPPLAIFAIITIVAVLLFSEGSPVSRAEINCDKPTPPNISTPGQATRYIDCLESVIEEMQANLEQNPNVTKDKPSSKRDAEATIDKLWLSFKSGDVEMFSQVMSRDTDLVSFGTDDVERWQGWGALEESIKEQFASFNVLGIKRKNKTIKYSQTGDTAWFSEVVDWEILSGGQKASLEGIRFTGVLENRSGTWVIVQFHSSVGVAGQVIEY
jgi:hypothetical protein